MDSQTPPDEEQTPNEPEPLPGESTTEQHTRELSQSLDALEDTIETEIAHGLEKAVPMILGVFVACAGLYVLATRVRKRVRRRRAARAT